MIKNLVVRQYLSSDFEPWNAFVNRAKNATFLFDRNFMEHHEQKFSDFSLIIQSGDSWKAILPANRAGERVHSHQFLSYGGLLFADGIKQIEVIEVLKKVLFFLENQGVKWLRLKVIPTIYCSKPADDLVYALWIAHGQLIGRNCLKVLDLKQNFRITKTRKEAIRCGAKNSLEIREETDFEGFWNQILTPNMQRRHGVQPVHSLDEIVFLQSKFPSNIRQFNVYHNNDLVAGTTIFVTKNVVHPQHISALENRSQLGSIDFLYHHLLTNVFADCHFFDFGSSNQAFDKTLDANLIFWKESFGTSSVVQDCYEVETKNHVLMNNYLV